MSNLWLFIVTTIQFAASLTNFYPKGSAVNHLQKKTFINKVLFRKPAGLKNKKLHRGYAMQP